MLNRTPANSAPFSVSTNSNKPELTVSPQRRLRTWNTLAILVVASSMLLMGMMPAQAQGAVVEVALLFNTDANPATGCTEVTVDGPFKGVEEKLVTTFDTSLVPAQVTGIEHWDCNGETFTLVGPINSPFAPPWNIGDTVDINSIETYLPMTLSRAQRMSIATTSRLVEPQGGAPDAILSGADGDLILMGETWPIPALGTAGLAVLILSLSLAGLLLLRNRKIASRLTVLLVGVATVAWAAMLPDGQLDEWAEYTPLGIDAEGDAAHAADLLAVWGRAEGGIVFVRFDFAINNEPVATDDEVTTDEDTQLSGNVLDANPTVADSDLDGDALTVTGINGSAANVGSQLTLASGALLTVNTNGSFDYDPDGQFESLSCDETFIDTFNYSISDINGGSDDATVNVTVTGINDEPVAAITPASYTANELAPLKLHGTGLSVADVDAGDTSLTATLSVVNGTLEVVAGTTSAAVTGSGTSVVMLTGTLVQLNDLLAGNLGASIQYLLSSEDPDTLTLMVDDGGNDGACVSSTGSDTATITVVLETSVSISDAVPANEPGVAEFAVALSAPSYLPVQVAYATSDDTAVAGADYVANSGVLTFPPGVTAQLVSVSLVDDLVFENDETFLVDLSNPVFTAINDPQGVATILNDDPEPEILVNDVTIGEDSPLAIFNVTLANPSSMTVTVNYSTADVTATSGEDYQSATGTLTFAPGVLSQTVSVTLTDDLVYEGDETFYLDLSNPVGGTIADPQGQGTILENDPQTEVAINDVFVEEDAGAAVFVVMLSQPSGVPVTVDYATSDSTAQAGSDYTASAGTLTFVPGETVQMIHVPIIDDLVYGGNETFNIDLSSPVNATISDGHGIGTIQENEPLPQISIHDAIVNEDAGVAVFNVLLLQASGVPATVNYATSDSTAQAGSDYTAKAGTLTFAPGETTKTIVVDITDDSLDEFPEMFNIDLSSPVNATIGGPQGHGTIMDDDPAPLVSINDVTVNEDAALVIFTVAMSEPSSRSMTVDYASSDGTAESGLDYTAVANSLTFDPGDPLTKEIEVSIIDDVYNEGAETFSINLFNPVYVTILDDQGQGTILDTIDVTFLILNDVSVAEGTGDATILGNLSNPPGTVLAVVLSNGAILTFPPGSTTVSSTPFPIQPDDPFLDPESYTVSVTNASGGGFEDLDTTDTATVSVSDTIDTTTLNLSGPASVNEADPAVYWLNVSNPPETSLQVDIAFAHGTTGDADFTASPAPIQTVTLNPGETSLPFGFSTAADTLIEVTENFTVSISGTSGGGFENLVLGSSSIVTSINDAVVNSPPVVSNVRTSGTADDISILYDLADADDDLLEVVVEYRGGSAGSNWVLATTSGATSGLSWGTDLALAWHSGIDESSTYANNMVIRITPSDGVSGTPGLSSEFSINNDEAPVASNVRTTGTTDDILITYDLADAEFDLVDIVVEYKGGSAPDWTMASVSGTTSGLIPVDDLTFTWQSALDQAGIEADDFMIRITPSDGDSGTPGISSEFSVDNNDPPVVNNVRTSGTTDDIVVLYDLADAEGDVVNIVLEYSGGSAGSNWVPATTSGATSGLSYGWDLEFSWHSGDDEGGTYANDMMIRITPSDLDAGTPGFSSTFFIDNNDPPVVSNVVATGSTASILITFDLADFDGHLADIQVEYIGGSRSTWTAADVTGSTTTGLAPGSHSVVWLSDVDQGGQAASDYRIRITPSDAETGTAGTSAQFAVSNP